MPQHRCSARYPDNKVSSDLFWDFLNNKYPDFYKDGLRHYLEYKSKPSHSLKAILTGDLFEAAHRCDSRNWNHIRDWCRMLFNDFPSGVWGSSSVVNAWLERDSYDLWVDYYIPRIPRLEKQSKIPNGMGPMPDPKDNSK